MGKNDRFQPQRLRGGVVVQSGIDLRARAPRPLSVEKGPFRAVVANTRLLGDTEPTERGISVECDVILVRYQIALHGVQVLQKQHGVNNVHDLWIPRPSTRVVDDDTAVLNLNRTVSRRGSVVGPATPLGNVDGDMVLVDFIEGNQDFPIIIGALPHERTNRLPHTGAGWREGDVAMRGEPRRDEHYTSHYGTEVRINEQGDMVFDTVGAFQDISTEDESAAGGQIRFRVKNSERLTIAVGDDEDVLEVWKDGSQLKIDLGEGATQRIPLGDDQVVAIKDAIDAIDAFASALATATPAAPNAALTVASVLVAYSGGPPGTTLAPKLVQAKLDLDEALSDLARTKKT